MFTWKTLEAARRSEQESRPQSGRGDVHSAQPVRSRCWHLPVCPGHGPSSEHHILAEAACRAPGSTWHMLFSNGTYLGSTKPSPSSEMWLCLCRSSLSTLPGFTQLCVQLGGTLPAPPGCAESCLGTYCLDLRRKDNDLPFS